MRVNAQLLRSKAKGPLQTTEYLDLSNLGIVAIEKLNNCAKLHTLILRGNDIFEVANLEHCAQLWRLDLGNNCIKSLDGLSRFVALGTLNLANNALTWHELGKIRHVHILNLSLHGNPQLEKDPYYRIHVIDCLPNVWMLDGRLVTSAERLQVKHFFQDSALTEHPIRHKLAKEWFVPSNLKKIEVNGVFGAKATHVMTRFPTNGVHNIETDRRRLKYVAFNIQEDLVIDKKYTNREYQVLKYRVSFLEDLLEIRPTDLERCNMLLLLLVTSLEFVLPTHLVKETLDTAKLSKVGKVYTMDLFLLPRDVRCQVVCVLLAAVKIDKDDREDGGLYDKLYLCLFYTISELMKLSQSTNTKQTAIKSKLNTLYSDYKCLLASEVIQLLCIVPAFFEYISKDIGVMNLIMTGTGDSLIAEKIARVSSVVEDKGGELKRLYEDQAELLLQKVQEQCLNLSNRTPKMPSSDEVINSMKALPMKRPLSALELADFHSKGVTSPHKDAPRIMSARRPSERGRKRFPRLGDILLLGPQTLGKIVSLPQPFVALVSMDSVPVANGAMESKLKHSDDHYTYINMDHLGWDLDLGVWKPKGAIGDSLLKEFLANHKFPNRLTMHNVEDLQKDLERKANMDDNTVRPNSPNWNTPTPGPGQEAPLVYSPRHPPTTPEKAHRPKEMQETPRPVSSLLKEKLDLKLDLTRRVLSSRDQEFARPGGVDSQRDGEPVAMDQTVEGKEGEGQPKTRRPVHIDVTLDTGAMPAADTTQQTRSQTPSQTPSQPTSQVPSQVPSQAPTVPDSSASPQPSGNATPTVVTAVGGVTGIPGVHDCIQCAMEAAALAKGEKRPVGHTHPVQGTGENKENHMTNGHHNGHHHVQSERPHTSAGHHIELQLSIPGDTSLDTTHSSDASQATPKGYRSSARHHPSPRFGPFAGKKVATARARPFSAVDAYRYIVAHPIRPSLAENAYNTSYQQQRTEAWKQSVQARAQQNKVGHWSPPPARPSSPALKNKAVSRPGSAVLNLSTGNHWLAGGRDVFWENYKKRPMSGHVPGWKEGLPDSMQRPRSAVASRTWRRSKASSPVTPSSLMYESVMQGYQNPWSLPELTDLSDYPSPTHQYTQPRALGTPTHGTDFYHPPAPDTIYRTPPSSPRSRSPKVIYPGMHCILESPENDNDTNTDTQVYS
ncbi:uncharacterized protein LOC132561310 [Ylistrum balloti]|uniref:uncharacterized protein LOC132561310 n=1 Tax=Ylistrum balloti TaxID=509963 RepID=UPI002905AF68|nr:uncharacterized protein LOC132561310 [Ylistrum balloti]